MSLSERVWWVKRAEYCDLIEERIWWAAENCHCAGCNFLRRQWESTKVWQGWLEQEEERLKEYERKYGEEFRREMEYFMIQSDEELLRKQKQELVDIYIDEWLQDRGEERYRNERGEWRVRDLSNKRESEGSSIQEEVIEERLLGSKRDMRSNVEFSGDGSNVAEQFR